MCRACDFPTCLLGLVTLFTLIGHCLAYIHALAAKIADLLTNRPPNNFRNRNLQTASRLSHSSLLRSRCIIHGNSKSTCTSIIWIKVRARRFNRLSFDTKSYFTTWGFPNMAKGTCLHTPALDMSEQTAKLHMNHTFPRRVPS
jgi:hypothetical protein